MIPALPNFSTLRGLFLLCCTVLLFSSSVQAQYISRPEIVGYTGASFSFCQGFQLQLKFDAGNMQGGNVFTAQLSDSNGNWVAPVAVGTLTATNGQNQFMNVTIPAITPAGPRIITGGRGYRLRIISSRPAGIISQLNEFAFQVIRTTPVVNPQPQRYGDGQWVAHVYTWQLVQPTINGLVNPAIQNFWDPNKYKGYFTKRDLSFDLNWDRNPIPTGNNQRVDSNMVSCVYRENFSIRFRRRETLPFGYYSFQFGADDGIRFSTDGGATWYFDSFREQQYNPQAPNGGCGIPLGGTFDFVVEYFQRFVQSRVLVNIVRTADPNQLPQFAAGQGGQSFCASARPFQLTATPPNGTFIGPGTSPSGMFDPRAAGVGTRKIYYQTGLGACRKRDSITLTITPSADARFIGLDTAYCLGAPATTLQSLNVGVFSGPGITGNTWSATAAGVGTHLVRHIVAGTGSLCPDTVERTVRVYAPITGLSFSLPTLQVCNNATPIQASYSQTAGGSFAGPGISQTGLFNPAGLNGPVRLVYRARNGACRDSIVLNVVVNPAITASFTGLTSSYCTGSGPVTLVGSGGGTFIGPGVTGNQFNPASLGPGSYTVAYAVGGPCPDTARQTVTIIGVPGPITTNLPTSICPTANPIVLQGTPAGGIFSGPGVGNGVFNPAGLSGTVRIWYKVNAGACSDSVASDVTITSNPAVTLLVDTLICLPTGTITLRASTPGGVWSGPGITGDVLDPSVAGIGLHQINYVINTGGCTGSASIIVRVAGFPTIGLSLPNNICFGDVLGGQITGVNQPVTVTVQDQAGAILLQAGTLSDLANLRLFTTANLKVVVQDLASQCQWSNIDRPAFTFPTPSEPAYVTVASKLLPSFTLSEGPELLLPTRVTLINTTKLLGNSGRDTASAPAASNFSYIIEWGDGSAPEVIGGLTSVSHDYQESALANPNTKVRLTVQDLIAPVGSCTYTAEQNITLLRAIRPNVITPNGDNLNDALVFDGMTGYAKLVVYNRYGVQVHEESLLTNTWAGSGLPSGTYFYRLLRNNGQEIKGFVEVLR